MNKEKTMSNNNYQAVYKNTGMTPRTMAQAYKNADYATPIYRQKSDLHEAWEFISDAVVGFVYVAGVSALVYSVLTWLR